LLAGTAERTLDWTRRSPHAATQTQTQASPAANTARHPDRFDARPVPLWAGASAGGERTHLPDLSYVGHPTCTPREGARPRTSLGPCPRSPTDTLRERQWRRTTRASWLRWWSESALRSTASVTASWMALASTRSSSVLAGGEGTVEILQPWGSRADSEHHARAAGGRLVGAWCASEALRPSAYGFSRTHVDVGMASGGGLTQLLAPARGEVTLMAAAVWFPPSRSGWT